VESNNYEVPIKTIYVPLDHSETSRRAIPLASTIAKATGATVRFVHATHEACTATRMLEILKLLPEETRNVLMEPLVGSPAEAITEKVMLQPYSLIVMAMTSKQKRPTGGLGPIALEILRRCERPIVFVPPEGVWENWKAKQILLPQDSTAECARAVSPMISVAEKHDAVLTILHVPRYSDVPLTQVHAALPMPRYMDQPQYELMAWREEFIERIRTMGNISDKNALKLVLGVGDPGEEVVNWSHKLPADLIVIPWYRHYETAVVLRRVLEDTICPVMVVPVTRPKEKTAKAA